MRDRSLTPFFPLDRGQKAASKEHNPPGVSARLLEGKVVANGRYLLLHKTGHTTTSARYQAKDMVGGLDVEIELSRDEIDGYIVSRSDATPRRNQLPDLLGLPTSELRTPPRRRKRPSGVVRAWRAIVQRLRSE